MTTMIEYRTTLDGRDIRVRGKTPSECAWLLVLAHWPQLRRIAGAFARKGVRLDEEEVLHDLCLDVVHALPLWDPARGTWLSWARTRARLVRITQIRGRDRNGEGSVPGRWGARLSLGMPERDEGPAVDPGAPVGAWGTPERVEALAETQALYDRADDAGRDAILAELHGLRTPTTNRSRIRAGRWHATDAEADDRLASLR